MDTLSHVTTTAPPLVLWLLLTLCRCTGAQDETRCDTQVLVRRHTVLRTALMKPLAVPCPIRWSDCDSVPTVTWCKLLTSTDCVKVNTTHRVAIHHDRSLTGRNQLVSHLKFHHVQKYDDGLYRCEISGPVTAVSHAVNISVYETLHITTESPAVSGTAGVDRGWLLLVCVSVACAVLTVIVVALCFCTLRAGNRIREHCFCTETVQSYAPGQVVYSRPTLTEQ